MPDHRIPMVKSPATRSPRARSVQRLVCAGFLAAGAAVAAAPAMADCLPAQMSRVTVMGQGTSRVAPDLAVLTLGVSAQADLAAQAMADVSAEQARVLEALAAQQIDPAQIQTSGLNLSPMVDYQKGNGSTITGYSARNMVTVRVTDVAKLGEVLDAVVAAGANEINGISYQRQDDRAAQDEARGHAVAEARHRAEIMADAAGLTLGPVLTMRETGGFTPPQPMMTRGMAMADTSVPVEPGEVAVAAMVEVEFALTGEGALACQGSSAE